MHVPGGDGAHVTNAPGVRVDRLGYALVPYLTPYQLDTIQIDPQGLPLNVQLDATSAQVAPYAGAVVVVDFKSKSGRALIVRIRMADGKPAPFGAQVFNAKGEPLGVVGQAGLALLRGVEDNGRLSVQWQDSEGAAQACRFSYGLPTRTKPANGYTEFHTICVTDKAAPRARKRSRT